MEGAKTHIDGVDIRDIAERFGTPVSVNVERAVRGQCRNLKENMYNSDFDTIIRYAPKSNTLAAMLKIVESEDIWFEFVSPEEGERLLKAEIDPKKTIYTSEDCSDGALAWCISKDILVNCRSLDAIQAYGNFDSASRKICASINPGEGTGHHTKCSTGGPASKFGIWHEDADKARKLALDHGLEIIGIHSHVGSGGDVDKWLEIAGKVQEVALKFPGLEFVNYGGGLPVAYRPDDKGIDIESFGKNLTESHGEFCISYDSIHGTEPGLEIEPGRYISAESGFIITQVLATKKTPEYNFVIVNTGFNHLIRPAMYGSYHPIWVYDTKGREQIEQVVGDVLCESGGVFTQADDGTLEPRLLPKMEKGDLLIIGMTGAYGETMSSNYNSKPKIKEVLIDMDKRMHLIREQQTVEDMIKGELVPYHLRFNY